MGFTRTSKVREYGSAVGESGRYDSEIWGDGVYDAIVVSGKDLSEALTLADQMIPAACGEIQEVWGLLAAVIAAQGFRKVKESSDSEEIIAVVDSVIDPESCFHGSHYEGHAFQTGDGVFHLWMGGKRTVNDFWVRRRLKEQDEILTSV